MLYNKDWDKPKTETDPFSLGSLIAWLETKDPSEAYNYFNGRGCLLALWVQSIYPDAYYIDSETSYTYIINGEKRDFDEFHRVVSGDYTFGAALERAKAMRDGRKV